MYTTRLLKLNFRATVTITEKISKITRYNSRVIMVITTAVKSKCSKYTTVGNEQNTRVLI